MFLRKRLLFSIGYNWNEVEIRPQHRNRTNEESTSSGRTVCSLVPNISFAGCEAITGTSFPWPAGDLRFVPRRSLVRVQTCTYTVHSTHGANTCIVFSVDFQKSPHVLSLLQQQAHYTQTLLNRTTINEARNEASLYICRCCCMHARCQEDHKP